jgi:hypothetical protein
MCPEPGLHANRAAAAFEKNKVSPLAVQLADLFPLADLAESAGFVEGYAGRVLWEDSRLEGPDSIALGVFGEGEQQGFAETSPARRGCDVDRDFCDSGIDTTGGGGTEGPPGNHGVSVSSDETGMRMVVRIPPFPAGRFGLEGGIPGGDAFAVDGFDRGPVVGIHG